MAITNSVGMEFGNYESISGRAIESAMRKQEKSWCYCFVVDQRGAKPGTSARRSATGPIINGDKHDA